MLKSAVFLSTSKNNDSLVIRQTSSHLIFLTSVGEPIWVEGFKIHCQILKTTMSHVTVARKMVMSPFKNTPVDCRCVKFEKMLCRPVDFRGPLPLMLSIVNPDI